MLQVTDLEIKKRLAFENPWWSERRETWLPEEWRERPYLDGFLGLFEGSAVRRAVVLLGPRRVGKTVLLTQAVDRLIQTGRDARTLAYIAVDTPTYTGLGLEKLLHLFMEIHGHGPTDRLMVLFDEIQYLKDWERHLKSLVDSYPSMRFAASGSATAALLTKSRESGAGRFTEFMLPPLGFAEFLRFRNWQPPRAPGTVDDALNAELIAYLNFGGFPEAVTQDEVRRRMDRFVANDVIDKVLLRDLPSLYGITDTQELKRLFAVLAYNAGQEVNLDGLARSSGVAKNTLRRYLDYLEAAFLIVRVHRIGQDGRPFQRATHFKVYLANPSIRAALFGDVDANDPHIGPLMENVLISQIAQTEAIRRTRYARWAKGEVDVVFVDQREAPIAAIEVKWSRRDVTAQIGDTPALLPFCKASGLDYARLLGPLSDRRPVVVEGLTIVPMSLARYCLWIGLHAVADLASGRHPRSDPESPRDGGLHIMDSHLLGEWSPLVRILLDPK